MVTDVSEMFEGDPDWLSATVVRGTEAEIEQLKRDLAVTAPRADVLRGTPLSVEEFREEYSWMFSTEEY